VAVKPKEFTYELELDRAGRLTAGGRAPLDLDPAWTPEHLVLAGLVRCTLQSLRYHADRVGVDFAAFARAAARVTKRADDERYGFVDLDVAVDVELEPVPDDVRELLDRAEWDCFVGASLRPSPRYRWTVNGTAA